MIYGHQATRGWSTSGVCVCVACAAAVGAGLGLLFAPQRGTDSRRTLGDAATRLRDHLHATRQPGSALRAHETHRRRALRDST